MKPDVHGGRANSSPSIIILSIILSIIKEGCLNPVPHLPHLFQSVSAAPSPLA